MVISKSEIEEKISRSGDFVKIGFLDKCLKEPLGFDMKKFVMIRLSGIYEGKKMFSEAGKLMRGAADINTTFEGKIIDFVRAGELYVRGGKFLEADACFNNAISCGNEKQKIQIKISKRMSYITQGLTYLKEDKRRNAMEIYERIMEFDLNHSEKRKVQEILLDLYDKLGKIREYGLLKKSLEIN
jgi:tetratricopeptide (TPR) repeat protein